MNPWISMWLQPRRTVRWLLEYDPERHVFLLAALAGFSSAVDRAILQNLGDALRWPGILLISAIIGPILGVLSLLIGAWLLRVTGAWLGGRAKTQEVITAYAWSNLPTVASIVLLVPELLVFGQGLFTITRLELSGMEWFLWTVLGVVKLVLVLWGIGLFLLALSEVHRFTVWRALGSALLAVAIILVPLLLLRYTLVGPGLGI